VGEVVAQASAAIADRAGEELSTVQFENAIVRASVKFTDQLVCLFDLEFTTFFFGFDDDPTTPGGVAAVAPRSLASAILKRNIVFETRRVENRFIAHVVFDFLCLTRDEQECRADHLSVPLRNFVLTSRRSLRNKPAQLDARGGRKSWAVRSKALQGWGIRALLIPKPIARVLGSRINLGQKAVEYARSVRWSPSFKQLTSPWVLLALLERVHAEACSRLSSTRSDKHQTRAAFG
jgi:hypothetical protein